MPDENPQCVFEPRHCRFCRRTTDHMIEPWDHGMHGGKALCSTVGCTAFVWLPRATVNPTRRPAIHRNLLAKYDRGFCELCLRPRSALKSCETLMAHHVRPFADEGEPTRGNVWIVCTACHSLIHWQRKFNGRIEVPRSEMTA